MIKKTENAFNICFLIDINIKNELIEENSYFVFY